MALRAVAAAPIKELLLRLKPTLSLSYLKNVSSRWRRGLRHVKSRRWWADHGDPVGQGEASTRSFSILRFHDLAVDPARLNTQCITIL
jgi:hypothetical protein